MVSGNAKKLFGTEFSIVPHGLSEEEVVSFVNNLKLEPHNGGFDEKRQSSLITLAEQTVIEAHKLAESIKEQAVRDAEAEAARITKVAEEGSKRGAGHPPGRHTEGRGHRVRGKAGGGVHGATTDGPGHGGDQGCRGQHLE